MPLAIWKERPILVANVTSLTTGIILIGISSFLPTFVQGVMEKSPMVAGFTLTTMSIGWPLASTLAGRMLVKIGYRVTSIFGGISLVLGSIAFVTMTAETGPIWAAAGSFFVGVGMGLTSTAFIVSIQSTVGWQQRGIATAANMFMRNLGNTIGAALLGGILNSQLRNYLSQSTNHTGSKLSIESANILLKESERNKLPITVLHILQDGLTISLHAVYFVVLVFAVLSFIFVLFIPKKEQNSL
jgi:MFS family permease